eukprot:14769679-Alexandrium_andersonii.AAC.1
MVACQASRGEAWNPCDVGAARADTMRPRGHPFPRHVRAQTSAEPWRTWQAGDVADGATLPRFSWPATSS